MNRKDFLRNLLGLTAAAVVVPSILSGGGNDPQELSIKNNPVLVKSFDSISFNTSWVSNNSTIIKPEARRELYERYGKGISTIDLLKAAAKCPTIYG